MKYYKIIAIGVFMAVLSPISAYAATIYTGSFGDTLSDSGLIDSTPSGAVGADVWLNTQTPDFTNNTTSGFRPFSGGSLTGINFSPSVTFDLSGYLATNYPSTIGVPLYFCIDRPSSFPTPCTNWVTILVNSSTSVSAGGVAATSIISTVPYNNQVVSSTSTVTIGALVNINISEWIQALAANNGNWFVQITLTPNSVVTGIPSAAGSFDSAFGTKVFTFPITDSRLLNFSTTTDALAEGRYNLSTQIIQPSPYNTFLTFFGFGSAKTLAATTTTFISGTPTGFDTLTSSSTDIISDFFASSSPALIASCASFTGFNLGDCLNLLFIPQSGDLARVLNDLNDGLFTFVPWGYVTRTINIIGGQATSSFPLIAVGIPDPSNPHQYMMFHFDPNEMIAGAAALDNGIVDPVSEDPVMPAIKQIVDAVIALSVLTFIFYDLVGGKKSGAVHKTKLS